MVIRPSYTAQTQLFVAIQSTGSAADLQQGNTFTQARVESYVKATQTPAVLQPAIDSLGMNITPAQLSKSIQARSESNTVIISLTATDASPVQASAIAEAVSTSLIAAIDRIESPSKGGSSPVKLSILTPAVAPTTPSAPNTPINLTLGALIGLLAGIGAAVVKVTLNTKIGGEADLRRATDAPILGGIAFDADAARRPLLTQTKAHSPRAEAFRQIRTNLQFAHVSHESKALLVTSSLPGEGKSTTAANLAIAMAQAGQSVVLVDADLRRPQVDEYLGLDRHAGLTTALIGTADVNDLLQPWGEGGLYVLTSGHIPPNPSELLGSAAMKDLIAGLEQAFDAVIIDAPPLLPVTDAAVLAQQVGGVVLVVGASRVKYSDLQKSLAHLNMVQADVLGVVLNLLPTKGADAYSYYSYESAPEIRSSVKIKDARPKRKAYDDNFDSILRGRN